jgi:hypothetical protein
MELEKVVQNVNADQKKKLIHIKAPSVFQPFEFLDACDHSRTGSQRTGCSIYFATLIKLFADNRVEILIKWLVSAMYGM